MPAPIRMDSWVLERLHHLLVPHNRAPTDPTRNSTFDCSNHPGPGIIDASVEIAKVVEEPYAIDSKMVKASGSWAMLVQASGCTLQELQPLKSIWISLGASFVVFVDSWCRANEWLMHS